MEFNELYEDMSSSVSNAARDGNASLLKTLIANGRPINSCDNRGWNALHNAAAYMRVECAQILLDCGLDVNAETFERETAIKLACQQFNGSEGDLVRMISVLLSAGADPNLPKDNPYQLPLHICLDRVNNRAFKKLIKGGADVHLADGINGTPLIHAVCNGNMDAIQYLIKHGATLKGEDSSGLNVLHTAIYFQPDDMEILDIILAHKDCTRDFINSRTSMSTTPLMMALQKEAFITVSRLLELGADCNAFAKDNVICLSYAVQFCNPDSKYGMRIFREILNRTSQSTLLLSASAQIPVFHLAIEHDRFDYFRMMKDKVVASLDDFAMSFSHVTLPVPEMKDQMFRVCDALQLRELKVTPLLFLLSKYECSQQLDWIEYCVQQGSVLDGEKDSFMSALCFLSLENRQSHYAKVLEIFLLLLKLGADFFLGHEHLECIPISLPLTFAMHLSPLMFYIMLLHGGICASEVFTKISIKRLCCYFMSTCVRRYRFFMNSFVTSLCIIEMFIDGFSVKVKAFMTLNPSFPDEAQKKWTRLLKEAHQPKSLQNLSANVAREAIINLNLGGQGWKSLLDMQSSHFLPNHVKSLLNFSNILPDFI